MAYLEKIGKRAEGKCIYCDETDDAVHTIFSCHRWQRKRMKTEMTVGTLSAENLVKKILETKENWTAIENFLVGIIERKEEQ